MIYLMVDAEVRELLFTLFWGLSLVIFLVIVYVLVLRRMKRKLPDNSMFATVMPLEIHPATGVVDIVFTLQIGVDSKVVICDNDENVLLTLFDKFASDGQTIVRFDTTQIANGSYFYMYISEHQKTMKKILVQN